MTVKSITLICLSLPLLAHGEQTPHYTTDPDWQLRMMNHVQNIGEAQDDSSIERLGELIRKLNIPRHRERDERPVFKAAVTELIAIPGHARYFHVDLMEAYRAYRYPDSPEHQGIARKPYNDSRLKAFRTWINLPSPETVDILCKMLEDTWYRKYEDSYYLIRPLGEQATHALSHLGIEGAPSEPLELIAGVPFPERERWLEWWAEVKSGERLLAFEGQPVAFQRQANETWETQSRKVAGESPVTSATDVNGSDDAERRFGQWPGWALLVVILGVGVGWAFRVFHRVGKRS